MTYKAFMHKQSEKRTRAMNRVAKALEQQGDGNNVELNDFSGFVVFMSREIELLQEATTVTGKGIETKAYRDPNETDRCLKFVRKQNEGLADDFRRFLEIEHVPTSEYLDEWNKRLGLCLGLIRDVSGKVQESSAK